MKIRSKFIDSQIENLTSINEAESRKINEPRDVEELIAVDELLALADAIDELPDLPELPPPPETLGQSLADVGKAILSKGAMKELHREEKKQKSPFLVQAHTVSGTSETIGLLMESIKELNEFTSEEESGLESLGISAAILDHVGETVTGAQKGVEYLSNEKLIKKLNLKETVITQSEERLREKLKTAQAADRIDKLQSKVAECELKKTKIQQEIKRLSARNEKLKEDLLEIGVKAGIATTHTGSSIAAEIVKNAATSLQIASLVAASAGSTLSLASIGFSSKEIYENREVAEKIEKERAIVHELLKTANQKKDLLLKEIFELRLRNLELQELDNNINTVRAGFTIGSSVLGLSAGVTNICAAAGTTLSVGVTAAVTATGIGALVIGGAAIATGVAYLSYKNRHAIANRLENASINSKDHIHNHKIESLKTKRERINQLEKKLSAIPEKKIKELSRLADLYNSQLEELANEKTELAIRRGELERNASTNPLTVIANKAEQIYLEREIMILDSRYNILLGEYKAQVKALGLQHEFVVSFKDWGSKISKLTTQKIKKQTEKRKLLNEKRAEINDAFKYGRFLGLFAKDDRGKPLQIEELRLLDESLYNKVLNDPQELIRLRDLLKDIASRSYTDVPWEKLKLPLDKELFFDILIKALTAKVERGKIIG